MLLWHVPRCLKFGGWTPSALTFSEQSWNRGWVYWWGFSIVTFSHTKSNRAALICVYITSLTTQSRAEFPGMDSLIWDQPVTTPDVAIVRFMFVKEHPSPASIFSLSDTCFMLMVLCCLLSCKTPTFPDFAAYSKSSNNKKRDVYGEEFIGN